jgi:hypothetical protein
MAHYTQTDRNGNPNVFKLKRNENGLWLNGNFADPGHGWYPRVGLVFSLGKSEPQKPGFLNRFLKR